MKIIIFIAVLAVLALADPWKSCGKPSDHMKIKSLTITPSPLSPGQNFTISFDGVLDEDVTGGVVSVKVKYLGVVVFDKTMDICTMSPEVPCPIKKGEMVIKTTQELPKITPKGKYTGHIIAGDQKKEEIACLDFEMRVAISAFDDVFDDSLISSVNSRQSGWVAKRNRAFEGMKIGQVMEMLGAHLHHHNVPQVEAPADFSAPDSFDSRQKWPGCIHDIRDQGHCGSCWAFGLTEALSDRFCIASGGSQNVILSPQYVVSCDKSDLACRGGYLDRAWNFMQSTGACTEKCWPYESGSGSVPSCRTTCKDGSALKLYKATNIQQPHGEASMQNAIMSKGPIEVAFQVYRDFMSYHSGVYHHSSGELLGGHAVKGLGWGVEGGQKYWLCANSWNTSWGDNGFFKILRGHDECGIESNSIVGDAKL